MAKWTGPFKQSNPISEAHLSFLERAREKMLEVRGRWHQNLRKAKSQSLGRKYVLDELGRFINDGNLTDIEQKQTEACIKAIEGFSNRNFNKTLNSCRAKGLVGEELLKTTNRIINDYSAFPDQSKEETPLDPIHLVGSLELFE